MVCFDASGFLVLTQGQNQKYTYYWDTFETIQNCNILVSTQRAQGNVTNRYYTYRSFQEKEAYLMGRILHIKRYPNSNFAEVQQNY
jgi:hypothetical protein